MMTKKLKKYNRQEKGAEIKHSHNALDIICIVLLFITILLFFVKFAWAIYTSTKTRTEFMISSIGIFPNSFKFSNYIEAFKHFFVRISSTEFGMRKVYFEELVFNSLMYALITTMVNLFVTVSCAYAVSRFNRFFMSKVMQGIVLVYMTLPIYGTDSSGLVLLKNLGIFDTNFALIITNLHFLGFNFLLYTNLFKGVGKEYVEAAKIDGASEYRILWQIAFPFVKGIFWLHILTGFIAKWSDYSYSLIYMPTHPTVSYGLLKISLSSESAISSIPIKLAACMIVFIPIFILFIIFRKKFLTNDVSFSGIKG